MCNNKCGWCVLCKYQGQSLIDEQVLRDAGMTDFSQYACVPGAEPMELTWNMEAGKSPNLCT